MSVLHAQFRLKQALPFSESKKNHMLQWIRSTETTMHTSFCVFCRCSAAAELLLSSWMENLRWLTGWETAGKIAVCPLDVYIQVEYF